MHRAGELTRWPVTIALSLAVMGGLPWLLPPLLREIAITLFKACAIAVIARAAFVALLVRR